jgi:hypothetical protein
LIDDVGRRVSAEYNRILPQVPAFAPDQAFVAQVGTIRANLPTAEARGIFDELLRSRLLQPLAGTNGQINGATYQAIKSDIATLARDYSATVGRSSERQVGNALGDVVGAFQDLLSRAAPPSVRPTLRRVDTAYANLLRLENAAGRQGAVNGVFTPAHLSQAVKQLDESARGRAFSRGNALMQDLADAGKSTLPSNVPDSGTPLRGALMALAAGGAVGVPVTPSAAVAGTGLAAAYTPWGQQAINAVLARQPGPVAQGIGGAIGRSGGMLAAPIFGAITGP